MSAKSWLSAFAVAAVAMASAAGVVAPAASASAALPYRSAVKKATSPDWAGYAALAGKGTRFRYVAADFDFAGPAARSRIHRTRGEPRPTGSGSTATAITMAPPSRSAFR
jgi:hypothetical protein